MDFQLARSALGSVELSTTGNPTVIGKPAQVRIDFQSTLKVEVSKHLQEQKFEVLVHCGIVATGRLVESGKTEDIFRASCVQVGVFLPIGDVKEDVLTSAIDDLDVLFNLGSQVHPVSSQHLQYLLSSMSGIQVVVPPQILRGSFKKSELPQ